MSSERKKRVITPNRKFADSDEYYELAQLIAPAQPSKPRKMRKVYRLLKRKDIRNDLVRQEVHIFWPEDALWYEAKIEEVNVRELSAYVLYTQTREYEDIDLEQLIEDKQIAAIEERPADVKLHSDEIPVDPNDAATAVYEEFSDDHSDSDRSLDSEDDEPLDVGAQQKEKVARHASHKQVQRSAKRPRGPEGHPDNGHAVGANKRPATAGANVQQQPPTAVPEEVDPEVAEAEAFQKAMLAKLMGNHAAEGGSGGGGAPHGTSSARQAAKPPPMQRPTTKKLGSAGSGHEAETRRKAAGQVTACLEKAKEELRSEGYDEALPPAEPLGTQVEAELYQLQGSLNAEYKSKFRSLIFNLRDPANPELRARVLRGELLPAALVRMGAAELASRTLSEWRSKREEEAAKAVFLDPETAARFSTAAAAALSASRVAAKIAAVPSEAANLRAPTPPVDENQQDDSSDKDQQAEGETSHLDTMAGPAASLGNGLGGGDSAVLSPSGGSTGRIPSPREGSLSGAGGSGTFSSGAGGSRPPSSSSLLPTRGSLDGHNTSSLPLGAAASLEHQASDGAGSGGGGLAAPRHAARTGPQRVSLAADPAALQPLHDDEPIADMLDDVPYDPDSYGLDSIYDPNEPGGREDGGDGDDAKGNDGGGAGGSFRGRRRSSGDGASGDRHGRGPSPMDMDQEETAAAAAAARAAAAMRPPSLASSGGSGHLVPHSPSGGGGHASGGHHHHNPPSSSAHHGHHHGQRQHSSEQLPSPRQLAHGEVHDLAPLVAAAEEAPPGMQLAIPGARVYEGELSIVGMDPSPRVAVSYLAGIGSMHHMLLCGVGPPYVKGQVKLRKVESFLDELRRSRNRTVTLGLATVLPDATPTQRAVWGELVQAYRDKTGVCTPTSLVESYFIGRCHLSARLLKTARLVSPPSQVHLLPSNVGDDQLLVAIIHRRDWNPNNPGTQLPGPLANASSVPTAHSPPHAQQQPLQPPQLQLLHQPQQQPGGATGDPRQQQQMGPPAFLPPPNHHQQQQQGQEHGQMLPPQLQPLQPPPEMQPPSLAQAHDPRRAALGLGGPSGSGNLGSGMAPPSPAISTFPPSMPPPGMQQPMQQQPNTSAPPPILPSGITLEGISALAAALGVQSAAAQPQHISHQLQQQQAQQLPQQQQQLQGAGSNNSVVIMQADGSLAVVNLPNPTPNQPPPGQHLHTPPHQPPGHIPHVQMAPPGPSGIPAPPPHADNFRGTGGPPPPVIMLHGPPGPSEQQRPPPPYHGGPPPPPGGPPYDPRGPPPPHSSQPHDPYHDPRGPPPPPGRPGPPPQHFGGEHGPEYRPHDPRGPPPSHDPRGPPPSHDPYYDPRGPPPGPNHDPYYDPHRGGPPPPSAGPGGYHSHDPHYDPHYDGPPPGGWEMREGGRDGGRGGGRRGRGRRDDRRGGDERRGRGG